MARNERAVEEWLKDIVHWGDRLAVHLDGMSEQAFLEDARTQDAVARCLECIGEASRQVVASGEARQLPGIEFVEAYWTRNRIAHGYYDLNQSRVWATATQSAPNLVSHVRRVLKERGSK
jgi:uncharacterized protein with HEPN domain